MNNKLLKTDILNLRSKIKGLRKLFLKNKILACATQITVLTTIQLHVMLIFHSQKLLHRVVNQIKYWKMLTISKSFDFLIYQPWLGFLRALNGQNKELLVDIFMLDLQFKMLFS